MTRLTKATNILCVLLLALAVGAVTRQAAGQQGPKQARFAEADLFLELNDTDGDLGIHASIDGEPWTDLRIEGPGERTLADVVAGGRLRSQGLTQLFFESAEPPFDELAPDQFFRRFPEGQYEITGRLLDGGEMESVATLSHVLAAPPQGVTISGLPSAENCDAPFLPVVFGPVVIDWDPVTQHHAELGRSGPVKISRYQLFVEREGVKLSLDLPPGVTEFEVPMAITKLGDQFKFEIIARTAAGNNTAIESCFIAR